MVRCTCAATGERGLAPELAVRHALDRFGQLEHVEDLDESVEDLLAGEAVHGVSADQEDVAVAADDRIDLGAAQQLAEVADAVRRSRTVHVLRSHAIRRA